jgi:hypothetical protein
MTRKSENKTNTAKQSNPITGFDRPCEFQEVEAPRFLRQSAHEVGMVVSPTHGPPLPAGNIPGVVSAKKLLIGRIADVVRIRVCVDSTSLFDGVRT